MKFASKLGYYLRLLVNAALEHRCGGLKLAKFGHLFMRLRDGDRSKAAGLRCQLAISISQKRLDLWVLRCDRRRTANIPDQVGATETPTRNGSGPLFGVSQRLANHLLGALVVDATAVCV